MSSRVLGVGVAVLDAVFTVENFPAEDSEIRADDFQYRRGGNTTNTLAVLSQHGYQCGWLGVLGNAEQSAAIISELERFGINYEYCPVHPQFSPPTSFILKSKSSGSRTIVHYRDLPELAFADMQAVSATDYDWLHLEGRNIEVNSRFLESVSKVASRPGISIEIEKPRENIEKMFPYADVLFFSQVFFDASKLAEEAFVSWVRESNPDAMMVILMGAEGVLLVDKAASQIQRFNVKPVDHVVDSIGAGDTFIAGFLAKHFQQFRAQDCIIYAQRLVAKKLQQQGFDNLGGV